MDRRVYILLLRRGVRPDRLHERPWRDVVDHDAARLEAIHVPAAAIAGERDDREARMGREQITEKVAQSRPLVRRDTDHGDVALPALDSRRDLTAARDLGDDLDVV